MSRAAASREDLSATSYAILGLLAIQPWSTYELAVQMERTLANWWPRARSKLYEEPKKLAALGLASTRRERVGRRPRTVYTITAAGRRALKTWLRAPGRGPELEWEQLTKLFFIDHGTTRDARAQIDAAREWAANEIIGFAVAARPYLVDLGPFPERVATNMIVGRFMIDFYGLVYRWAEWAEAVVAGWPDDPRNAEPDWSVMEDVVKRGDDAMKAESIRRRKRSS